MSNKGKLRPRNVKECVKSRRKWSGIVKKK